MTNSMYDPSVVFRTHRIHGILDPDEQIDAYRIVEASFYCHRSRFRVIWIKRWRCR